MTSPLERPTPENIQLMLDYMAGSKLVRVSMAVKNNPLAVAKNLGIRPGGSDGPMVQLLMAMDDEELFEVLDVPYIVGKDPIMDGVYNQMMQRMLEAGGAGLENAGPDRFVGLAVAGLFGVASAFTSIQSGKDAQKSANAVAVAEYEAAANAQLQADAAARARKAKLKKLAPWAIAVLVVIILLIYRSRQ